MTENCGVFMKKRPGYRKAVTADCFEVKSLEEPPKPERDQVVVETLNFSLDPVLRFRMDEHEIQLEYMKEWSLDRPCQGLSGVGRVLEVGEGIRGVRRGDLVTSLRGWAWQRRQVINKAQMIHLSDPSVEFDLYSYGISSLTGYLAVTNADCVLPAGSQTAVVSTACGSVGLVTAQVLSMLGCDRVVGLTSTSEKCDFLNKHIEVAAAVCYKSETFATQDLPAACPKGVDIFVDLVGGEVSNAVKRLMRKNGHILSIGSISTYQQQSNGSEAESDETPPEVSQYLRSKKVTRHNFAVFDVISEWPSALVQLREWVTNGHLKLPITRAHGLNSTGASFVSMMSGGNIGKQIVEI